MKNLIMAAVVFAIGVSVADEAADREKANRESIERRMRGKAAYLAAKEKKTGGNVVKPGSGYGSFVFINANKHLSEKFLKYAIGRIKKDFKIDIKVAEADGVTPKNAAEAITKAGGDIGVVFTECAECPTTILVAPEQGWGIVNVKALGADGAEAAKVEGRVLKEFFRAFCMVAGASGSQYVGSLIGPARNLKALDAFRNDMIPPDVMQRVDTALPLLGVKPYYETTYIKACQEGWAPAPTNDNQKAIWDQVHELPSNPIRIKYDPKTGK